MKFTLSTLSVGAVASILGFSICAGFLTSCSSSGGGVADTGYGPFDSRGNYVEAWADNPTKWNRRSSAPTPIEMEPEPTLLAANDAPPSNMTPISTSAPSTSKPVQVATLKSTSSTSSIKPRTTTTNTSSKPKSTVSVAKTTSKAKPKTVASKSRSSSTARVVVKKGDTLSGLASRHKTSVSAIQKANGMRDTRLAIGRSLVIPRM